MVTMTETYQEDYFHNAIDPSFILDPASNNTQNMDFNVFPDHVQDMSNSELSSLLYPGSFGPTGFTPDLNKVLFDPSFHFQHLNNGEAVDLQSNPYFAQAAALSTSVDMATIENKTSQSEDSASNGNHSPKNPRKRGRPTEQDERTEKEEIDPAPPVKKRRNRKPKKQPSEEEARLKREKFLERNRIAASKCRTKKKESTNVLEDQLREFQAERKRMEYEITELMVEIDKYKEMLQSHAGCGNRAIDIWLTASANAIATEASQRSGWFSRRISSSASAAEVFQPSREMMRSGSDAYAASRSDSAESVQFSPKSRSSSRRSSGPSSPVVRTDQIDPDSSVFPTDEVLSPLAMDASSQDAINHQQSKELLHRDSGVSDMDSPLSETSTAVPQDPDEAVMLLNQRLAPKGDFPAFLNGPTLYL